MVAGSTIVQAAPDPIQLDEFHIDPGSAKHLQIDDPFMWWAEDGELIFLNYDDPDNGDANVGFSVPKIGSTMVRFRHRRTSPRCRP